MLQGYSYSTFSHHRWGTDFIIGLAHDISGYLIFIFAFSLLCGVTKIISFGLKPVVREPHQEFTESTTGKEKLDV